jgi:hypothetical protein
MPDRTELEWNYEPSDFFEPPYRNASCDLELMIEDGRALATMSVPLDPLPKKLEEHIRLLLESVFLARKLQVRRKYKLQGPRIYQYSSGQKNVSVSVGTASVIVMAGQADFIMRDATGNVVRDSKAERIAQQSSSLDFLAPKLQHSATLRSLFESYSRSIDDPNDELVHLYEIRDALSRHYGGERNACNALGISNTKWKRFGTLANVEPLEQSRHRGKHLRGRRQATDAELDEARKLAREWIIVFAQTV